MMMLNPNDSELPQFTVKNSNNEIEVPGDDYRDTPGNAETERLLAKIDTFRKGQDKQSLLITSAILGEGKSTISARIATSSARNRKNPTLLIDFDLRRPRIHQVFNLEKERGVADILSNRLSFESCIKNSRVPNLKILTSGVLRYSPMEVFNAEKAKRFFHEAHKYFDFIIVDSPPIIPVSDPIILGKVVNYVVLVVKAGATSKRIIKRALEMMQSVEVNVCGIIINNMNNVLPYYYDYKHYGYHYYDSNNNGRTDLVSA